MNAIQQTIQHWTHVEAYTQIPKDEKEHAELLTIIDELMDWCRHHKDPHATSLLNLIASNIEAYENRRYLSKKLTAVEMLKFLMAENHLGQNDLPEIGSQSLVSKILSGERKLTLEHVRNLAKKFGISPLAFL